MEITSINSFLEYYEKIRQRTLRVINCIPRDDFDWSPKSGKFSFADLIRHIGATERYLYVEIVINNTNRYTGHGTSLADGPVAVLNFLDQMHQESISFLKELSGEQLLNKCQLPSGAQITVWKWLRLMVEHEIHHRGHIYSNLGLLGIPTPPIFGLTSEELIQ